jgi:hypothetical protein
MIHAITHSNNDARALVPSDALRCIRHRDAEVGPLIVEEGFVRGAETGPVDLHENLAGTGLLDVNLGEQSESGCGVESVGFDTYLRDGRSRTLAFALPNGGFLLLGDVH